jgi:hypothetical protein
MLIGYGEMRISLLKLFVLFFGILHGGVSLFAQTLEVKLVDGRNGHPMVGKTSYVNIWVGNQRKEAISIPADGKGIARIQLTLNPGEVNIPSSKNSGSILVEHPIVMYDESFRINVPYASCASKESNFSWLKLENFSTKEVLSRGYVSPNTCGKSTDSTHPGQLILFVRPLTWWEKLKQ